MTDDLFNPPERNSDLGFRTVSIFMSERADKDTSPFKESDDAASMFGEASQKYHFTTAVLPLCLMAFGKRRRNIQSTIKI